MSKKNKQLRWRFSYKSLKYPILIWVLGITISAVCGNLMQDWRTALHGAVISTTVAFASYLNLVLPLAYIQWARKSAMIILGSYSVLYLWLMRMENPDISGFMIYALQNTWTLSVLAFLLYTIILPIVVGRAWCGWGCWIAVLFEIMPFEHNGRKGRIKKGYAFQLVFLFYILCLSVGIWYLNIKGASIDLQQKSIVVTFWMVLLGYYVLGAILAVVFKDNRAFCKYLCPVAPVQQFFSHFAIVKLRGDRSKCRRCMACEEACPMDIKIVQYVDADERILSGECILCMRCVQKCPNEAFRPTFGLDLSFDESIRYMKSRKYF
ncbi:MAG: 4Fe-4S binding protein [Hyphomonadaceae bacterium]|nr:4Fe-4S binding protein [Clostridia bacterium]